MVMIVIAGLTRNLLKRHVIGNRLRVKPAMTDERKIILNQINHKNQSSDN